MPIVTITESTLRGRAKRAGYVVHKSRRAQSLDNWGDNMLVDARTNFVVLGWRFNATLEEIDEYIDGDTA
jgi:hypothetical protein